jgi:hypothetical protein
MSSFFYYLGAAGDSALSVFGIRAPYEQPKYHVVGQLADGVEIRAYGQRVAVETPMRAGNDGEAFGRLFRYITGANQGDAKIAMTVPVEMAPQHIAMTVPVEMTSDQVMRFFLPKAVVAKGPPKPTDPLVHLVTLPPQEFAVLRFSGTVTDGSREKHEKALLAAVTGAGRHVEGAPALLSYDPPFALPFVRRNEVAVRLDDAARAASPAPQSPSE